MSLPRTYYLERSPQTGELQSADETDEADAEKSFYRPGELYVLVPPGSVLANRYALRAVAAGEIVDDQLEQVAARRFEVRFTGSNIKADHPIFTAMRAGTYRGTTAWLLVEQDPSYLDQLEERFGYNPIGDTSVGEPLGELQISPIDVNPRVGARSRG